MRSATPLLVLSILTIAVSARAEEIEGHARLSIEELAKPDPQRWAGRRLFVDARWNRVITDRVLLDGVPDGRVVLRRDDLREALTDDRTLHLKEKLERRRSNVRLFGASVLEDGEPLFVVARVSKLEDDEVELPRRLEAVRAKPVAERDLAELAAIAETARTRQRLYGAKLERFAAEADREALTVGLARQKPGDHAQALALATRAHELATKDGVEIAIGLLDGVARGADRGSRERTRALEQLAALGARERRGTWLSETRYNAELGRLKRAGKWIRRERAELDDAIARELANKDPVRLGWPPKGVTRGCKKDEVLRAPGWGFPSYVDRRITSRPRAGDALRWDQWVYPDGRRVYFLNGEVCEVRRETSPWPTN